MPHVLQKGSKSSSVGITQVLSEETRQTVFAFCLLVVNGRTLVRGKLQGISMSCLLLGCSLYIYICTFILAYVKLLYVFQCKDVMQVKFSRHSCKLLLELQLHYGYCTSHDFMSKICPPQRIHDIHIYILDASVIRWTQQRLAELAGQQAHICVSQSPGTRLCSCVKGCSHLVFLPPFNIYAGKLSRRIL